MSNEHQNEVDQLHTEAIHAMMRGDREEGERMLTQALTRGTEGFGAEHPSVLGVQHSLAGIYVETGRYAEAEAAYQSVLAAQERGGPECGPIQATLIDLSKLYLKQDRVEEAEALALRSLGLSEDSPSDIEQARARRALARVYERQGRVEDATRMTQGAQSAVARVMAPMFAARAEAVQGLGLERATLTPEECAEIEPYVRRALAMNEQLVGPEHPAVAVDLEQLAILLRKMHRDEEAAELEDRARRIRELPS